MYKNKIYIICLLFALCSSSFAQWYPQNSNSTSRLHSVYFINQNTGWVCGFETVLKTTNGGVNWTSNFLAGYLRSIYFLDGDRGWICGDNGKLYKTIDGGNSWTLINLGITYNLNQITFRNNNTGLIVGNQRTILKTTNSGLSWTNLVSNNNSLDFLSVKIINSNTYVVTGTESTIYKSTNSGSVWDTLSLGMPNPLFTVEFINENTGWVSGCCGMFMRTINAGMNWTPEVYLTPGVTIFSSKFANEYRGWQVGGFGYILKTSNGGQSWDSLISNTHSDLYSIHFVNDDTGFVVGNTGLILKTTNGGGPSFPLGIIHLLSEIPNGYNLFQNYPNPFNPSTYINFSIPKFQKVNLTVYNILGNKVEGLINDQTLTAGTYKVDFNGNKFSSGIYYYILKTENFIDTKKMVLLK